MAYEKEIINKKDFELLNELLSFRNRVVHRFIISELSYSDLEPVLPEYEKLYSKLMRLLAAIEQPDGVRGDENTIRNMVLRKIKRI